MTTTAAVYLRVSTEKQTVENQRAPLLAACAARGWTPRVYEEVESAKKARPVFEDMMRAAHAGELRAVVVVALDRLGRSLIGVLETVQKLDRCGVTIVSMRESWLELGGPQRQLLVSIFAWVAEQEHGLIVERSKAGQARARRQGKHVGRPPANAEAVRLALVDVSSGAAVRDAARRYKVSERTLRRRIEQARPCGATIWRQVDAGQGWFPCVKPVGHEGSCDSGKSPPLDSAAPPQPIQPLT